jgi:hypothetical protein
MNAVAPFPYDADTNLLLQSHSRLRNTIRTFHPCVCCINIQRKKKVKIKVVDINHFHG